MKVYLINLDRDKDRLAAADAQLKRLGVAYERVPAVYGKDLSPAERAAAVNRFRWWCAVGRPIMPGEIGCALSHRMVWQRICDDKEDLACVLEDDGVLSSRFAEVLTFLEHLADIDSPNVFMLSKVNECVDAIACRVEPIGGTFFTDGYVLTRTAAESLIDANYPLQVPCDWWGRWVRRGAIKLFQVFPTVCKQDFDGFVSNTEVSLKIPAVQDLPWWKFCIHKMKRLAGRCIDEILEHAS